jgi:hypothetical protein
MPEQDLDDRTFKVCSTCKKPIAFEGAYYRCSVSTCNRSRVAYYFCSVPCWDAHVPEQRHRDAWAEPAKAPSRAAYLAELSKEESTTGEGAPTRRVVSPPKPEGEVTEEVLVVVSKLKAYIKARSGMSTSDGVIELLSDHLRRVSDQAIENATAAGRKTVMDRDFHGVLKRER